MSEIIRISERGKKQLIGLKRTTKIAQWNILCRWALTNSLRERSPIRNLDLGPMSTIEMTWETFCGPHSSCIEALINSSLNHVHIQSEFTTTTSLCIAHIHRGIGNLSHAKLDIQELVLDTLA